MRSSVFILLIGLISHAYGQNHLEPYLKVDKWYSNDKFKGDLSPDKLTILDFWFTQCGPCVYSIPHMNNLFEKYKNSVNFISLTFEGEKKIEKFLLHNEIKGHIAIDTLKRTVNFYKVNGYPYTIILNREGDVLWHGHPMSLKEEILEEWLTPLPSVEINNTFFNTDLSQPDSFISFQLNENHYMNDSSSAFQFNLNKVDFVNFSIPYMISHLMGYSPARVRVKNQNTLGSYDLHVVLKKEIDDQALKKELITNRLLAESQWNLNYVTDEMKVYHLKVENDSLFKTNGIDNKREYYGPGWSGYKSYVEGSGVTLNDLTFKLESKFNKVIINKSNIFGYLSIKFPISSFQIAVEFLKEKYGIVLIPSTDKIETLVFSSEKQKN